MGVDRNLIADAADNRSRDALCDAREGHVIARGLRAVEGPLLVLVGAAGVGCYERRAVTVEVGAAVPDCEAAAQVVDGDDLRVRGKAEVGGARARREVQILAIGALDGIAAGDCGDGPKVRVVVPGRAEGRAAEAVHGPRAVP